jgi:threonine dehydrogenase-like Zn-dependent dehydrogenase
MRVLAYYGKNDIRDEEWPRQKKIPSGYVRVEVRAVTLGERDRFSYLKGEWKAPYVVGAAASGLVVESADESLKAGQPIVLWLNGEAEQGLAAENVLVPIECVCKVEKAISYADLSIAPHIAALLAALPKTEGVRCTVLGESPQAEMLRQILPLKGYFLTNDGEASDVTFCANADASLLDRAIEVTNKGGTIQVLSIGDDSPWEKWPLAQNRGLCFNFDAAFSGAEVEEAVKLLTGGSLSFAAGRRTFIWDDVDPAFQALGEGSMVTLTQESFPEPYFP